MTPAQQIIRDAVRMLERLKYPVNILHEQEEDDCCDAASRCDIIREIREVQRTLRCLKKAVAP